MYVSVCVSVWIVCVYVCVTIASYNFPPPPLPPLPHTQGLMYGYATDETEEMMPLTIMLAHKLNQQLAMYRRDGTLPWVRPDSKTQVSQRVSQ